MKTRVQNEGWEGKGREVEKSQKKEGMGTSVSERKGFTSQIGGDCLGKPPQASTMPVVRYSGKVWGALRTWVARVFRGGVALVFP
jgi:hypothetical protein